VALWTRRPVFYDNAGMLDSSTDLNVLRTGAGLIDRWSYRNEPFFDSTTGVDRMATPGYANVENPLRIWWGGVRFQTGCTTLTVEMKGLRNASETIKVYWNGTDLTGSGTLAMTLTPPGVFGAFSGTYTLPGGLVDGTVYRLEIRAEGAHALASNWQVQDVYLSPVTKSGWVAAPTFTVSTVNATKLNQLADAEQWLYERMRLVPMVPHLSMLYNQGPFNPSDAQHVNRPMYYGSVGRYYSNSTLRIAGIVQSFTTTGWFFYIQLNGSTVYTSPTYGVTSAQPIDVRLDLSAYTLGSRVAVAIFATATNGGTVEPKRFTRWTFGIMHAVADSSGWPYASLPTKFAGPATGTSTWSTVVAALNSLSTVVNNAKTRIDARAELWGRVRAMRRHYTRNTDDEPDLFARARPQFPWRVGSEVYVQGADIEIQWGLFRPGEIDQRANGYEKYAMSEKQSVDDSVGGKLVYLDDLPGLDVGSTYIVFGDPWWAGEYIS
jgi:hypothetical protein